MQLCLGDFVFYSLYIGSGSPQEKLLYMTFPHAVWVLARDSAYVHGESDICPLSTIVMA